MMNIEDDFMWVAGNAFSEMRLMVEGAITLFEDDAGVLCRLAREAQKNEAQLALNDTHGDIPLFLKSNVGSVVSGCVHNAEVLVKFRDGGMVGEGAFIPVFHILVRMFFAL